MQYPCVCVLADTRSPLSENDLVRKINAQASIPVGLTQVKEALKTMSDAITRLPGGNIKHKLALDT